MQSYSYGTLASGKLGGLSYALRTKRVGITIAQKTPVFGHVLLTKMTKKYYVVYKAKCGDDRDFMSPGSRLFSVEGFSSWPLAPVDE